jgi:predicted secreted protein
MDLILGFAIYFIIWWMTLFLVLPFGFRSQQDEGERVLGTVASAPARYRALRTIALTTIISAALFGGWYIASDTFGLTLDSIPQFYPDYRSQSGV